MRHTQTQGDGAEDDSLAPDELASMFSSAQEEGYSRLTELLFAGEDQQDPPSRKRAKVTRSRQLSDMRVMANALEYTLEDLKSRLYAENPEDGRLWERIAQRMLVERRLAARENARLQGLVRQQIASARALHFALSKTPALLVRLLFSRSSRSCCR